MTPPQPPVPRPLRETLAGSRFIKVTGPAGDWIVFNDATLAATLTQGQIIALCDRRNGVGATGVVAMSAVEKTAEHPTMRYHLEAWRADGSTMDDMTEAARAATSVMAALGILDVQDTSHHVFRTNTEFVTTVYTPAYIGVDIGQWSYAFADTAAAVGSDALVMTAGLTDPRPGLTIRIHHHHITIAIESYEELETIDLTQQPSVEPAVEEPTSVSFVTPQDPLIDSGMGQLTMRHSGEANHHHDLAAATAAAAVSFQQWSGLEQLNLWNVKTPLGQIVVQLHDHHRLSTFTQVPAVFFGRF